SSGVPNIAPKIFAIACRCSGAICFATTFVIFSRNGGGSVLPQPTSAASAVPSAKARIEDLSFIDLINHGGTEFKWAVRLSLSSSLPIFDFCVLGGEKLYRVRVGMPSLARR